MKNQKRITYRTATGNALLRAYNKASKVFASDPAVCSTEQDAGFIILPKERGETPKGFQVFVKMCRYDEELLRKDPTSGGLLENLRRPRRTRRKTLARDKPGFAGAHL